MGIYILNDTLRERLMFHSIQYRNGWLAASDLFDMFTQSIKFYTFHYQYRCLKNGIHQTDSKNGWLLLSASSTAKFSFVFVLTGKCQVNRFSSQQREHRFFWKRALGIFKIALRWRDWHIFMWRSIKILNIFSTLTLKQIF